MVGETQDVLRAQTAGENMVRDTGAWVRSGGGLAIVGVGKAGTDEDVIRPVSSPMNLPTAALSETDRIKAWRNFELRNMSEATEAAYALLLDDEGAGELFGEHIELDDGVDVGEDGGDDWASGDR